MRPPPHDRSDFRHIRVLNFWLAWTKSVPCWPASFNIFDQLLADYSIEFELQFEKQHVPFPCPLDLLPKSHVLLNSC